MNAEGLPFNISFIPFFLGFENDTLYVPLDPTIIQYFKESIANGDMQDNYREIIQGLPSDIGIASNPVLLKIQIKSF